MKLSFLVLAAGLLVPALALAVPPDAVSDRLAATLKPLDALLPELDALYVDLHRTPELSFHEEATAGKLETRLRALGFDVQRVAGTGLAAVLRNGEGPVVALRTDLDALPVEETTGLPFASRVKGTDPSGKTVPVMHACGHDLHMTAWLGAATLLARARDRWKGTLIMVGQPGEEVGEGALTLIKDGLFTRFPKPAHAVALHNTPDLPAGQVGVTPGFAFAAVNSVDITIHGKGGHGGMPHRTIDPIVIGARMVLAFQTLVSREKDPLAPAVLSVGAFNGGTKHNVIPDEVTLKLTVRTYAEEVRVKLLDGIKRIAKAEAAAAGAPREPDVVLSEWTPPVFNDPGVAARLTTAVGRALGPDEVVPFPPVTVSEDFCEFGRAGIPSVMLWLGSAEPKAFAAARASGTPLPSLHSSNFAPDRLRAIPSGVKTLVASALELLAAP